MKLRLTKEQKAKLKNFWKETKATGSSIMKSMPRAARGFGTSASMIQDSFAVRPRQDIDLRRPVQPLPMRAVPPTRRKMRIDIGEYRRKPRVNFGNLSIDI